MKFIKVTSNKYIGQNGISLIECRDGSFSICKGSKVTKWGTGFKTVRSAEHFLSNRDVIRATTDRLPIEDEDIEFIQTVYGMSARNGGWQLVSDTFTVTIPRDFKQSHKVLLKANAKEDVELLIDDVQDLLLQLDNISNDIFSSVIYRGIELRPVIAKSQRRTAREIMKDMIRVKSSNVWAYGVEIKDNDSEVGDVYIQFKGPNGGPDDVYRYYDVPVRLWRKFVGAPSKGHFLWKYLRNNFLYSKLTGDKRGKLPNAVN